MQDDIGPLLHRVSSEIDQISDQVLLERLGIGLSQFRVLLALSEKDSITQKEIAFILNQSEASVSRQIELIKKKSLIEVRKNTSNRRERLVSLTDKGRALASKATSLLNDYHAPLFSCLNEQEQWQLMSILHKVRDNIPS